MQVTISKLPQTREEHKAVIEKVRQTDKSYKFDMRSSTFDMKKEVTRLILAGVVVEQTEENNATTHKSTTHPHIFAAKRSAVNEVTRIVRQARGFGNRLPKPTILGNSPVFA